ncbi:hypothetical protein AAVH_40425, partial [Aphelenchoides avenae]
CPRPRAKRSPRRHLRLLGLRHDLRPGMGRPAACLLHLRIGPASFPASSARDDADASGRHLFPPR